MPGDIFRIHWFCANLQCFGSDALFATRTHYPDKASALDFKDAASPRFGHSDVVFDIFIETGFFLHLIALPSNFDDDL